MWERKYRILAALLALVIISLGALLWVRVRVDVGVGQPSQAAPQTGATLSALQEDFVALVAKVKPTVVSVYTSRVLRVPGAGTGRSPFEDIPGFRFFFGPPGEEPPMEDRAVRGLGSGVIVRSDGYIVTNNHVVQGADRIWVDFPEKSQPTAEARLVGADAETDLAVLKVERTGLPAIETGDARTLKVGQWAIAFGIPFGLPQTMTVGVISALGRSLRAPNSEFSMENMIQTDAAINHGNSGGPLVDIGGRLIGINTMIFSETGVSAGVGFAIPVDVVQYVYPRLIEEGKIARGWLGIYIQDISPEIAEVFGVKQGVVVSQVVRGTPADKAGLKDGDIVTAFQGTKVNDVGELRDAISRSGPDRKVTLEVMRDGKPMQITIKTGLKPTRPSAPREAPKDSARRRTSALGIEVEPLDPAIASRLRLRPEEGLLIARVDPESAAYQAGVRAGLVLRAINRHPTDTVADFERVAGRLGKGAKVVASLMDPEMGTTFYIGFTL